LSLEEARNRTAVAYKVVRQEIKELRERLINQYPEKKRDSVKRDIDDLISKSVLLGSMGSFMHYANIYLLHKGRKKKEEMMVI